jgi:hypothetical protein
MSRLPTVLNALLKSSEVTWVYGRARVLSRSRSTALNHRFKPPLATEAKLAWRQAVTSVGVPDDGLVNLPVGQ